jgi:hypothetical protein
VIHVKAADAKMKETTRVQIELPPTSMERLKSLKDKTEAVSYAEVTKNAFKLYEHMIELTGAGQKFFVQDGEGHMRELDMFILVHR